MGIIQLAGTHDRIENGLYYIYYDLSRHNLLPSLAVEHIDDELFVMHAWTTNSHFIKYWIVYNTNCRNFSNCKSNRNTNEGEPTE